MQTHPAITVRNEGPVAVVTVDDGKANALTSALMNALRETVVALAAPDGAGAIVLAGRANFFSGGLDIKLLPTLPHEARVETVKDLGRMLLEIFLLPRPVIAAVTGHAIAGGALLALAADARIGAEGKARFGLNEVTIGLPLPTFGVEIARATIPHPTLTEAVLHGKVWSHAEAHTRGALDELRAPEAVLTAAIERATAMAPVATSPYLLTKRRLRGAAADVVRGTLDDEIEGFLKSFANL